MLQRLMVVGILAGCFGIAALVTEIVPGLPSPAERTIVPAAVAAPVESPGTPSLSAMEPVDSRLSEIRRMKAQGKYDENLWREYLEDQSPSVRGRTDPLDQGGEDVATATPIASLPYNDFGTTLGYLNNYDAACPSSTAPDVVYSYIPPFSQDVMVTLCGSSYDTKLFVFESVVGNLVGCNDDFCGLQSGVEVPMNAGMTYYIVVDGWSTSEGDYQINVEEVVPCVYTCQPGQIQECAETADSTHAAEDCNGGCNNEGNGGVISFGHICSGQTICCYGFNYIGPGGSNSRDTDWHLFTMDQPGDVTIDVFSGFPMLYGVVDLDACIAPAFIEWQTAIPCEPSQLIVPGLAAGTYALFSSPVDFSATEPDFGLMSIQYPTSPNPCTCANPEVEPNDDPGFVTQTITPGQVFCGEITCPSDIDYYYMQLPHPSAVRFHLRGDAAAGSCPGGLGLHPSMAILAEDGDPVAFAGDTLNLATEFESDFKFGAYPYIVEVAGANGTIGSYEIEVELIQLDLVALPAPVITLHAESGGVRLRWHSSYLPGEMIRIESAEDLDGPWLEAATVSAIPSSFFQPGSQPFEGTIYLRATALGLREADPFVGSLLGLGRATGPDFAWSEDGDHLVEQVEWAVNEDDQVVFSRVQATGVGNLAGYSIDQDNRQYLGQNLTAISDFSGHWMNIYGRRVLIEHIAFARDSLVGDVGIVDGRGWNEGLDTLMLLGDSPRFLKPNGGGFAGFWAGWGGWPWWDWCPGKCCRLKVIAFCTSAFAVTPACASPALTPCPCDPACWLGCPCPPRVSPAPPLDCCPPAFPCGTCDLISSGGLITYCMCPSDPTIPPSLPPYCMFVPFVKCKTYQCPQWPLACVCEAIPCPFPATWTIVPFVGPAMRAACKRECIEA